MRKTKLPFSRLEIVVETFEHLTLLANQYKRTIAPKVVKLTHKKMLEICGDKCNNQPIVPSLSASINDIFITSFITNE